MDSNPTGEIEEFFIDRISCLPNSILSQILSYLPTKQAIATSILSTNWKHISPFDYLPINLDLEGCVAQQNNHFLQFMNKLLNRTLRDVSFIESMSLCCGGNYTEKMIISWVSSALRLNLRHLDLNLMQGYTGNHLLDHLTGCTTLSYLKISPFDANSRCRRQLHIGRLNDINLPNLKTLKLYYVKFKRKESSNILGGFPVLEELVLNVIEFRGSTQFITSNSLKRLTLVDTSEGIDFQVPNLEHLTLLNTCIRKCVVGKVTAPLGAYIGTMNEPFTFSLTTSLHLSANAIKSIRDSLDQLPVFSKLTYLSLYCLKLSRGFEILATFLWNAPHLEKIILEEQKLRNVQEDDIGGFARFNKASMLKPPICVERHLKEIEFFSAFEDEEKKDEIKLMEYFLKNGKFLERLTLYCLPFENKSLLKKKLHKLPKQSKILYEPKEKFAQEVKLRVDRVRDGDLINY